MTEQRIDRGDGRDEKGRWLNCGNPKGRPRKVPDYDMADTHNFSQSTMEINVGGKKQLMTRQEILLMKIYESAMKGKVTSQKYLIEKFEEAELSRAFVLLRCRQYLERYDDDPESISAEELRMMQKAMDSLDRKLSPLRTRDAET